MGKIKRNAKLSFYGIAENDKTTYHRMKGFTQLSVSKNPKEYTTQYVDMDFEETSVVGYSPSISFGFDFHTGDAVHKDIAEIFDKEMLGDAIAREIVIVDKSAEVTGGNYPARLRKYTVVPADEGGNLDRYDYNGTFKVKGEIIEGTATTDDEWQTCTFTANE